MLLPGRDNNAKIPPSLSLSGMGVVNVAEGIEIGDDGDGDEDADDDSVDVRHRS